MPIAGSFLYQSGPVVVDSTTLPWLSHEGRHFSARHTDGEVHCASVLHVVTHMAPLGDAEQV